MKLKKGIEKFDKKTNKRIRKVVDSYKKKDGETVGQITILKV